MDSKNAILIPMNPTITIIILVVLGVVIVLYRKRGYLAGMGMKQIERKEEYKREVMKLFAVAGARVKNDDVQALLSVSGDKGVRYL